MMSAVENFSVFEMAGIVGVLLYLGSYAALQFQVISATGIKYPILNFLAASAVLISLFESFNLSSALIQISWIAISAYGITKLIWMGSSNKSSTDRVV